MIYEDSQEHARLLAEKLGMDACYVQLVKSFTPGREYAEWRISDSAGMIEGYVNIEVGGKV